MNPRFPILALVSACCLLAFIGFVRLEMSYIDLRSENEVRLTLVAIILTTFLCLFFAGIIVYLHYNFKQYP